MTYVVTYFDVQPSYASQAIAQLKKYCEASRADRGNAAAHLVQETSRPNRFVVVEMWTDESSFQGHESATHTAQFRSSLASIQNSPFDQRVHQGFAVAAEPGQSKPGPFFVVTHVD